MVVRFVTAVSLKTVSCWHFEESFRFHLQIRNHKFENSCLKEGGRSNLRRKTGIERDLGQIERDAKYKDTKISLQRMFILFLKYNLAY
jgi:hypothetical protein